MDIQVNDEWNNNIRCADDTVLMADNITDLQKLLDRINMHGKTMGYNINSKKTTFLIISRSQQGGKPLQRVNRTIWGHGFVRTGNQTSKLRAILNWCTWHLRGRKVLTSPEFDLGLRL